MHIAQYFSLIYDFKYTVEYNVVVGYSVYKKRYCLVCVPLLRPK